METVGVALIASNAEKTIKDCLESFIGDVDQTVVVVNNSKDKTEEICRSLKGVEVHNFEWVDDFAVARNFSFSKVKTDWLCWVDADDKVYQPENLRSLATNAQDEVGGIWFPYHYAIDEFGNPTTIYERERLLRAKNGWIWRGRLHETVTPLFPCKYVRTDQVIIVHNHLAGAPRNERNFRLLNIMLKEDPADKRIWLYLGHQHFAAQQWVKAAEWYLKFGSDKGALPLERYQALCYCAKAMREFGDTQSIEVSLMAVELFPNYKDAYLELAHSYLRLGQFEKAVHYAQLSDIKELMVQPPSVIFINPLEYSFNRYALMSEAYVKSGNYKEGLEWAQKAYQVRPAPQVKQNIEYLEGMILRDRVSEGMKVLAVHLLDNREIVKLPHLAEAAPYWFRETEDYKQLQIGVNHYTKDIKSQPKIVETKDGVIVNINQAYGLKSLLEELDNKYDNVTIIQSTPDENTLNLLCQADIEQLIVSKEGRHIQNLQIEPNRIFCQYNKSLPMGLFIKIFVGQGYENWTRKTIDDIGCGGSETAVAFTAEEFAKRGHQPIVYAMDDQIWDGVLYRHHDKFIANSNPCNIFISSRVPDIFYNEIPALQKWLWVHDIYCFNRLSPEVAKEIDVIIALSHWHCDHLKRTYPFLKDAEVWDFDDQDKSYEDTWTPNMYFEDAICNHLPVMAIIGDATDTKKFKNIKDKKVPHRFIWLSSPDRGLEQVLNLWPFLKKELPDAELKIFYGWNYFDSSLWIPGQRELKERLRELIKQEGVEWCGRVGQYQLAHELAKSQCLLYPPPHDFRETYGIAFLEAQAAGVIVFYRQNGALGETVNSRGIPLDNDMTQEQIVARIVTTLHNKGKCDRIVKEGRAYGLQRDWGGQVEKMLKLYERIKQCKR